MIFFVTCTKSNITGKSKRYNAAELPNDWKPQPRKKKT